MKNNLLQFVFFGTPDVASETLMLLKESGYIPKLIVTSPDRPSGRGMHLTQTPVALWAQAQGIMCLKPEKITNEIIEQLKKADADLLIVVAYGKILPQALIDLPLFGAINIHYSLLPRYRGASPVEQALFNGDKNTGVTIQRMAFKLDSGPIIIQQEESILLEDTKKSLRERLIKIGANMLISAIPKLQSQDIHLQSQVESQATYCTKIKKEDGLIDPNGNAKENYNKYRAYYGWPGIYFFIDTNGKNTRVKITKAKYENDSFVIERVIHEGKKEVSYTEFLRSIISM